MKFSINEFFRKCAQTRRKLRICPHLQKKSSMQNFKMFDFIWCKDAMDTMWPVYTETW